MCVTCPRQPSTAQTRCAMCCFLRGAGWADGENTLFIYFKQHSPVRYKCRPSSSGSLKSAPPASHVPTPSHSHHLPTSKTRNSSLRANPTPYFHRQLDDKAGRRPAPPHTFLPILNVKHPTLRSPTAFYVMNVSHTVRPIHPPRALEFPETNRLTRKNRTRTPYRILALW